MDKKSKEYWENRARENENKVYKKASDLKKELDIHCIQTKKEIQKSINDLIARYMFKTDLSYVDAMKYLTSKEFKEFRMSLEEYEAEIKRLSEINEELANKLRIELETLAMKSRITRLDSLKTQIDIELSKKISKDYNVVEKGISEVYRDFFKIQTTDFGLTGVNTVLPKKTLKMLMQQPWSGANFSERIWGNSEALGKVLKQEIIQSFMQGVSVKDLSDRIEKRFENDRYNTERLVRTELNYAFNQTTKLSYEEAEIEEYEFLAEIDSRTSEICKKLNGEKFKVKDARAGVNYPPMHPHCRSTTVAVLDFDNFGKEKITYEEEKAIMDYKSPKMYVLNDKLRQGLELNEDEKEWVKNLDSALEKMPKYTGEVIRTLYFHTNEKLIQFLNNYNPELDFVHVKEYMSTSAGEIYNPKGQVRIVIPNSKNGRDIRKYGEQEDEILYKRDCKFKILDVYSDKEGIIYIIMEELNG